MTRPDRRRIADVLLAVAEIGLAHGLFGNLHEGVVRVPDRLAAHRDLAVPAGGRVGLGALLGVGSPVRYYVPAAPVTAGAVLAAAATGWHRTGDRRHLATAAVGTVSAAGATAYAVRRIVVPVVFAATPPDGPERDRLRRWHRLDVIRMVATAVAWSGVRRVRSARAG
jgi:hypothetical protein